MGNPSAETVLRYISASLFSDDNDSANHATIEQLNQKIHKRKGREKTFRRDKLGAL